MRRYDILYNFLKNRSLREIELLGNFQSILLQEGFDHSDLPGISRTWEKAHEEVKRKTKESMAFYGHDHIAFRGRLNEIKRKFEDRKDRMVADLQTQISKRLEKSEYWLKVSEDEGYPEVTRSQARLSLRNDLDELEASIERL